MSNQADQAEREENGHRTQPPNQSSSEYDRLRKAQHFEEIKAIVNYESQYETHDRDNIGHTEGKEWSEEEVYIGNQKPSQTVDISEQEEFATSVPFAVYSVLAIGVGFLAVSLFFSLGIVYPLVGAGLILISLSAIAESRKGHRVR